MKTVTLEMPEDVYERAERRARQLGTSLAVVVGDLLRPYGDEGAGKLPNAEKLVDELAEVAAGCGAAGWDGQGAVAVSGDTLRHAQSLARALAATGRQPTVGVEADGHLTFEWYRDPRWLLSVSVGPSSDLYFAGLFGASDVRGHEVFQTDVPPLLRELIRRVDDA